MDQELRELLKQIIDDPNTRKAREDAFKAKLKETKTTQEADKLKLKEIQELKGSLRLYVKDADKRKELIGLIDEEIDIIWISGLLCYLHDEDCENLLSNCKKMISKNGRLILREPIGLQERFEIREVYSEALKTKYSNTYRTSEEYFELFARHDFKKMRDEDMFDKGSDLNKWSETRLRIFEFQV